MNKIKKDFLTAGLGFTVLMASCTGTKSLLGLEKKDMPEDKPKSGISMGIVDQCELHDGNHEIPKDHNCLDYMEEQFRLNTADSLLSHGRERVQSSFAVYNVALQNPDFKNEMDKLGIVMTRDPETISIRSGHDWNVANFEDGTLTRYRVKDTGEKIPAQKFDMRDLFRTSKDYVALVDFVKEKADKAMLSISSTPKNQVAPE